MRGFRCECGPAIDCTYPKCQEPQVKVDTVESLRQQLKLSSQREIKLSQCISRDQHNYASLQTAFNEMKALAAERLKQIVMLRDKLTYADLVLDKEYNHIVPSIKRALAATAPKP